jgi:hypothetical protein
MEVPQTRQDVFGGAHLAFTPSGTLNLPPELPKKP